MKKNVVLVLIIVCIGFSYLYSEEEKESPPWGFIFNTNNLLMDIDSYQAGVGFKTLHDNNVAIRYLADVFYSSSPEAYSGTLGVTYEKHLKTGRVSPYWGGFVEAGYIGQKSETDSDNWIMNNTFPVSVGAVLGVEFFIMEFLSIFAEYSLSFGGLITSTSTSVDGDVTDTDPEITYSVDSGIGNDSSIGIVIYLDNVVTIEQKDKKE